MNHPAMTANELRTKYLEFFKSKGHTIIPSASLIPENDPSVLFTTAGMHPLVPYLMGQEHPGGKRVVNVQKCVRTSDIDDVGDNRHLTFFEMLGNWSFGDYFKKEAIEWSFEFLTDTKIGLSLDPKRIYVTVFKGEENIPRDEESIETWLRVFKEKAGLDVKVAGDNEMIQNDVRIVPLGVEDNFWIAGATGPCGGDTEMFYDTRPDEPASTRGDDRSPASTRSNRGESTRGGGKLEGKFSDLVDNGRIIEIWNNVFMEFNKTNEGKYEKLEKPNVDTGMGVERTLAILNGKENVFETELFEPLIKKIEELSGKKYDDYQKEFRIIADHIKTATFMIADGVTPSNTGAGYILRRLIRRAIRYAYAVKLKEGGFSWGLSAVAIKMYGNFYEELQKKENDIRAILFTEEDKFRKTLENGLREFENHASEFFSENYQPFLAEKPFLNNNKVLPGKIIFDLYTTYGFPIELTEEIAREKGIKIDNKGFEEEMKKHQDLSRTASAGMFKGGLQDSGEDTAKLHTATHLLLAALRQVLGDSVYQKGSNITPERLRLDFSYGDKLTPEQLKVVEDLVNLAIESDLEVIKEEMSLEEAKKTGAVGVFEAKYGEKVTVYSIVNEAEIISREICGGPHASRTGALGRFRIQKEEASSAGVRRIKAVLE